MLDGLSDMTKTDEYRRYIKLNEHFKYSDDVMAKIKKHNPAFTKVTSSDIWNRLFGRTAKKDAKPFNVNVANNQPRWLYDISQTIGKPPPSVYQNVSGSVEQYQPILDCLISFSVQQVMFQEGTGYYAGIGQDSFIKDGKIVLRPALSEKQIILALIREVIRHTQTSGVVVEAVSYMVCRHLNIDTSDFTFGYLMELLGFDISLKILKDTVVQDAITKEAEIFIGYLNANLPFLQEATADGDILGLDGKPGNERKNANEQPDINDIEQKLRHSEEHTETIHGIDFRFIKIIKEFMNTLPDKSINIKAVRDFGYFDTNMIPIGAKVAMRLFSNGREIYRLHSDNTEELIESPDEINRHHGFFGISRTDWETAQALMLQDSVNTAKVKISRWDSIVSGDIKQAGSYGHLGKQDTQRPAGTVGRQSEQSGQGGRSRLITENMKPNANNTNLHRANPSGATPNSVSTAGTKTPAQANEPVFTADGSVIIAADDISHTKIENEVWLETALPLFFKQTGYKHSNIPYFADRKDFEITSEMKKINALMEYYCAYNISAVLNRNKSKSPDTGKPIYHLNKAVAAIRNLYSDNHIARAIDRYWADIKAPLNIKKQFLDCFERTCKSRGNKPKKSTLDEDIQRVKAKSEAKTGENTGAATSTTAEPDAQTVSNERNAEIFYIIENYNRQLTAKPKKQPKDVPLMPQIPSILNQMR